MSESDAISAAKISDPQAFTELYELHRPAVFARCNQLLNDPEESRDATQDVFLHLWQRIRQFDGRSQFSTWLYRMTTNKVLERMRKRKARPHAVVFLDDGLVDLPDHRSYSTAEIEDTLNRVTLPDRPLLELCCEGYTGKEIASAAFLTESAVKSRLARARKQLRQAIA